MTEPQTEAGKALLAREAYNNRSFAIINASAIVAIENEAARGLEAMTRERDALAEDEQAAYESIEAESRNATLDEVVRVVEGLPKLRLTGEQLDVDLHADDFAIDWDEFDEFASLTTVLNAIQALQP